MNAKNTVSGTVAAAVIALVAGAAIGYYVRFFTERPLPRIPAGAMAGSGMGMMGGSGMGMPMTSGPGGATGGGPSGGMELARLVRNLDVLQQSQGNGLSAEQAKAMKPILQSLKAAQKIDAATARAKVEQIRKLLTPGQQKVLELLAPPGRAGAGGGSPGPMFGGSAMGGMMGGPPSGAPRAGNAGAPGGNAPRGPMMGTSAMGAMMGGSRPDEERPFSSDRNAKALDDLIAAASKLAP
ncbi:MAG: hypothetical protein ACP5VE_12090 [Chthonomonadales bacterium]